MYSYETFPGQTIIRTCADGYTREQLLDELRFSGEGVIDTTDEGRADDFCASLVGRKCSEV